MNDDEPVFEVDIGGRPLRIWADGRVAGFEDVDPCVVVNRIPQVVNAAIGAALVRLGPAKARDAALNFRTIAKHLRSKAPDTNEAARHALYLDGLAERHEKAADQ